jgi:aminomethyltransferase
MEVRVQLRSVELGAIGAGSTRCDVASRAGKMVPFAGWSMPIQYKDSIMDSTTHCRQHASVFDVSHMCSFTLKASRGIVGSTSAPCASCVPQQPDLWWPHCGALAPARPGCVLPWRPLRYASHRSQGKDSIPFLESLVVGDLVGLKDGTGTLSVYTNEKGGIIDDTVITKASRWSTLELLLYVRGGFVTSARCNTMHRGNVQTRAGVSG